MDEGEGGATAVVLRRRRPLGEERVDSMMMKSKMHS